MSYPAAALQREIARRLNGECRINLVDGSQISLAGNRINEPMSCAECYAPCERIHARGLMGRTLDMEVILISFDEAKIYWACPGCGRDTVETTNFLMAESAADQVEADPLCFYCRKRAALSPTPAAGA